MKGSLSVYFIFETADWMQMYFCHCDYTLQVMWRIWFFSYRSDFTKTRTEEYQLLLEIFHRASDLCMRRLQMVLICHRSHHVIFPMFKTSNTSFLVRVVWEQYIFIMVVWIWSACNLIGLSGYETRLCHKLETYIKM